MKVKKKNIQTPVKRQMTICGKTFPREKSCNVHFPAITLSGKWLQKTGFKIGHVIDIQPELGKLVITIAKEQRFSL